MKHLDYRRDGSHRRGERAREDDRLDEELERLRANAPAPATPDGQRLIAHEVVHAVQQRHATAMPQAQLEVSRPGDAAERQADDLAARLVAGVRVATPSTTPVMQLQRQVIAREDEQASPGPSGAAAQLDDPAAPWTEARIRELWSPQQPGRVLEAVSRHDARNGLRLIHRIGVWEEMLMRIPHGAECPQSTRAAMYQLVHQRQVTISEYRELFHTRFNLVYERVFDETDRDGPPPVETRDEHRRRQRFGGQPGWDLLDAIWNQLDHLPDQDVSENSALRVVRTVSSDLPSHAQGTYRDGDYAPGQQHVISVDEDGPDGGTVQDAEATGETVRHEVGHGVHERIGGPADAWLQNTIGFTGEPFSADVVRAVIHAFGGFPATYEYPMGSGTEHPLDGGRQDRVVQVLVSWLRAGAPGSLRIPPFARDEEGRRDWAAYVALPEGARLSLRGTDHVAMASTPADPRGNHHCYSRYYDRMHHMSPVAHQMVEVTGRDKAAFAPAEFFAECYVEYYSDPQAAREPERRGGQLPAPIKRWFDGNVAPHYPPGSASGEQDEP